MLKDTKRVQYTSVTDKEALNAFFTLTEKEGIIPALETAHALAYAFKLAKKARKTYKRGMKRVKQVKIGGGETKNSEPQIIKAASVEDYELDIIRSITMDTSKVVSSIDDILNKAGEAEVQLLKARENGGQTTLITKSGTGNWDKNKFYPEKQKIVELALSDAKEEGKGGNHIFYPKASRRVPMLDDNMGPTGWLLKHEKYGGDSRINLFNKNNSIIVLAKDYIDYRNRNIPLFFKIYLDALKGESKKRGKLSASIIEVFDLINTKIQERNLDKDGLNRIGIGVLSFCQTWAKQNQEKIDTSRPQFSVMSPHFQTRFYIKDLNSLKEHIPEFPETEYQKVLKKFGSFMKKKEYNGSFVNIDELIRYKLKSEGVLGYGYVDPNQYLDIAGGRRKRVKKVKISGKWSKKYKKNINCKKPRGFSQKQYCKYSRKKKKTKTKKNKKK